MTQVSLKPLRDVAERIEQTRRRQEDALRLAERVAQEAAKARTTAATEATRCVEASSKLAEASSLVDQKKEQKQQHAAERDSAWTDYKLLSASETEHQLRATQLTYRAQRARDEGASAHLSESVRQVVTDVVDWVADTGMSAFASLDRSVGATVQIQSTDPAPVGHAESDRLKREAKQMFDQAREERKASAQADEGADEKFWVAAKGLFKTFNDTMNLDTLVSNRDWLAGELKRCEARAQQLSQQALQLETSESRHRGDAAELAKELEELKRQLHQLEASAEAQALALKEEQIAKETARAEAKREATEAAIDKIVNKADPPTLDATGAPAH